MNRYWVAYLAGAGLTLTWKYVRYVLQRPIGKSVKQVTLEWMFEPSNANASSWVATVAVVWVVGGIYIDRVAFLFGQELTGVPLHPSVAFFLGVIAEMLAPTAVKWTIKRLFPE